MSSDAPGQLFIVSAPSGTGKTTLVERLVQVVPDLALSRSFTSRPPRPGECDGVDYNFITRDLFDRMIRDGELLEWADVFENFYGTSASQTDRILAAVTQVIAEAKHLTRDIGGEASTQQMGDAIAAAVAG